MYTKTPLISACILSTLSLTGIAHAQDINAPLEGTYSAECDQITLTAAILDNTCETTSSSAQCSSVPRVTPYVMEIERCGPGEIAPKTFNELYRECIDNSDLVVVIDGEQVPSVEETVCTAAAEAYANLSRELENTLNGTFSIDVGGSAWVNTMSGRFENAGGGALKLPYVTMNLPWGENLNFITGVLLPFRINTSVCKNAFVTVTPMSGGNVRKSTEELTLNYNLNGQLTCQVDDDTSWTATINLHGAMSGEKLD